MDQEMRELQDRWAGLGRKDAYWAALTDKKPASWTKSDFARSGEAEIRDLLELLRGHGITPPLGNALDFGCGPGRLTGGLVAAGFKQATGVDISPSMLERARAEFPDPRCTFLLNDAADLAAIGTASMDLVYSARVLQHIPPKLSRNYIREFMRVCGPDGAVVFQLPTRPKTGLFAIAERVLPARALNKMRHGMEMHATEADEIVRLVADAGGSVVWIEQDDYAGPRWLSRTYVAIPKAGPAREPASTGSEGI